MSSGEGLDQLHGGEEATLPFFVQFQNHTPDTSFLIETDGIELLKVNHKA